MSTLSARDAPDPRAWSRRDWIGLAVFVLAVAALILYRAIYLEPRAWGTACAGTPAPMACVPRAALLWLQRFELLGIASLVLGGWAFLFRASLPVCVAAMVAGAAGVENYNATWGMAGLALGAWSWAASRRIT